MNISPTIHDELARQRQRHLVVAAEQYRAGHEQPAQPPRRLGTTRREQQHVPSDVASTGRRRLPRWLPRLRTRRVSRSGPARPSGLGVTAASSTSCSEPDQQPAREVSRT